MRIRSLSVTVGVALVALVAAACAPPPPSGPPTVTLEVNPGVAVESQGTVVQFRLTLSQAPPLGQSVKVYVRGDVPQSLTQFDLFSLSVAHEGFGFGPLPVGDFDFSGFTIDMIGKSVTINVPIFDDGTPEPPTTVTYEVVDFDAVPWGSCCAPGNLDGQAATGRYVLGTPAVDSLVLQD